MFLGRACLRKISNNIWEEFWTLEINYGGTWEGDIHKEYNINHEVASFPW